MRDPYELAQQIADEFCGGSESVTDSIAAMILAGEPEDQPHPSGAAPQQPALPCGHDIRFYLDFGESTHLPTGVKLPEIWACAMCKILELAALAAPATGKLRHIAEVLEALERSAIVNMNSWENQREHVERERWANYYGGQASGLQMALADVRAALAAADKESGATQLRELVAAYRKQSELAKDSGIQVAFDEAADMLEAVLAAAPPPREREAGK